MLKYGSTEQRNCVCYSKEKQHTDSYDWNDHRWIGIVVSLHGCSPSILSGPCPDMPQNLWSLDQSTEVAPVRSIVSPAANLAEEPVDLFTTWWGCLWGATANRHLPLLGSNQEIHECCIDWVIDDHMASAIRTALLKHNQFPEGGVAIVIDPQLWTPRPLLWMQYPRPLLHSSSFWTWLQTPSAPLHLVSTGMAAIEMLTAVRHCTLELENVRSWLAPSRRLNRGISPKQQHHCESWNCSTSKHQAFSSTGS